MTMLVTQQGADYPKQLNTVKPGRAVSPRPPGSQTCIGPVPPAASPAGGIVVFTRIWYKPPGWGAHLAGGVLHSPAVATVTGPGTPGDAQTVRCGPPMR